jgi:hypothetical protein
MLPNGMTVACALVCYLASIPLLAVARDKLSVAPRRGAVLAFALAHNAALTIFSASVAVLAWMALAARVGEYGFVDALCTLSPDDASLSTVFYASKYYEFVDTWLVVINGRRPSFLQVYHHVGVVVAMHLALAAGAGNIVVLTAFNSTVHAVMYAYYMLATLGIKWKHARLITMLQVAQFILGNSLTMVSYTTDAGTCGEPAVRGATLFIHAYTTGLVALFVHFYRVRYAQSGRASVARTD